MNNAPFFSARPDRAAQAGSQDTTQLTRETSETTFGSNGNRQNSKNGNEMQMAGQKLKVTLRHPYSPQEFEARGNALDETRLRLEKARANDLTRPLIEIVGVTGIGKTWLLNEIRERYQESKQTVGVRPARIVYFDFEQVKQENVTDREMYEWFTRFLESFVPKLEEGFGAKPAAVTKFLRTHKLDPLDPLDPDELQEILMLLKQWFTELRNGFFPILLLDSVEEIDAALLAWVEREILVPFVQGNQALVITAGRHAVKWREPEIRFYSDLIHLGPLEEWGKKAIPEWIHEHYSFGHPGLAWRLYKDFQSSEIGLEKVKNLYQEPERETEIVGPILNEAIAEIVLRDVPNQDVPREHMNLQGLLRTISVLRIFNPELTQAMVAQFGPKEYRNKSYMFFRQAAFDLVGSHIAAWRAGLNDYRVEPLVRRIMANALRIRNGQIEFLKRHHAAEEWYRKALSDAPSTAPNKMPELLYHYCVRIKSEKPDSLRERATNESQALVKEFNLSENDVNTLLQRLTDESDQDLQELRQDMLEVVDPETFQEMMNVVHEALPKEQFEFAH